MNYARVDFRRHGGNGLHLPAGSAIFLLCLFYVLALLGGCAPFDPLLKPEVGEKLKTAEPLKPEDLLKEPVMKLEDVPRELPEEIVEKARSTAEAKPGADAVSISLDEARKSALENNLGLQVNLFDPSISEQSYMAERAKFESVFTTLANSTRVGEGMGTYLDTVLVQPSINIPDRLGGTATLGVSYQRQYQSNPSQYMTPPYGNNYADNLNLGVKQPLLRGAGLMVNYASIETAGLKWRQSEASLKLAAITLLANVEKAYWDYYLSILNLEIQIKKYDSAEQQARTAKRLVEEGVRTQVEYTRAQAGVARQFESIITAETTRRRNERALKRFVNSPDLPVDGKTAILPTTHPLLDSMVFNRPKVKELAYQDRTELFSNEVQQAIDRYSVLTASNQRLPDLSMNFTYTFSGQQPTSRQALDTIFTKDFAQWAGGLSLSMPLEGNQAAKARWISSLLAQKQTLAARLDLEQLVATDVYNAIDAVEQNWERIMTNHTAVRLQSDAYEQEVTQFQNGYSTTNDVLIALNNLADAQSTEAQSITDYQKSFVDLAFATGTVFGGSRVAWSPRTGP
jgi:outer membrane protein TolC